MSMRAIAAGPATARVPATDQDIRNERDQQARHNLAARALTQPDPEAWLRDMPSALGLAGRTSAPPSPVRLLAPDEMGTERRPARSSGSTDTDTEPKRPRGRPRRTDEPEHGTRYAYNHGCRCDPCRDANNTHSRNRKRKHRDAVRAARAEAEQ